jgi:hypothetical protein
MSQIHYAILKTGTLIVNVSLIHFIVMLKFYIQACEIYNNLKIVCFRVTPPPEFLDDLDLIGSKLDFVGHMEKG